MTISTTLKEKISQVSLFQDLNDNELEKISLKCTKKLYSSNAPIIMSEEEENSFYIVSSGKVAVKAIDPGMNEKVLAYLEPGDFFGEMSAIDSEPRSADVISTCEVEVLVISRNDFLEILKTYPSVHFSLSREFCRRLRLINHRLSSVSLPANARIASALISNAREHGKMTGEGVLLPKITQGEIGKLSDSPRETVNRALSELKDLGLVISNESKQLLIPNLDKLTAWIKARAEA